MPQSSLQFDRGETFQLEPAGHNCHVNYANVPVLGFRGSKLINNINYTYQKLHLALPLKIVLSTARPVRHFSAGVKPNLELNIVEIAFPLNACCAMTTSSVCI